MKYKLVVCDMDGTLLTSSHKISEYTANIIKQIEDNGVKFIIATGRPYLDAKFYRDSLKLKSFLITSNGARAHDEDNNPIVIENIPKEFVKRLLAYNVGKDIHRNIYLNDDWIIEYEIEGLVEFHKESGYRFNIDNLNKYENEEAAKVFFLGKDEDIVKSIIEKGYFEFELYDNTDIYESVGFGDFIVKDEYSEYRVFGEDEFKELYKEVR